MTPLPDYYKSEGCILVNVCRVYWSVHKDSFITHTVVGQRFLALPPVHYTHELGFGVAITRTPSSIIHQERVILRVILLPLKIDLRSDFILQLNHFQMFSPNS